MSELKGNFLRHEGCKLCGSSDAVAVYTHFNEDEESWHCFSCGELKKGFNQTSPEKTYYSNMTQNSNDDGRALRAIERYNQLSPVTTVTRGISPETLNNYGFRLGDNKLVVPIKNSLGELHGYKWRAIEKKKDSKNNFGYIPVKGGSLPFIGMERANISWTLIIHEGELDMVSGATMFPKASHVSVPNGGESLLRSLDNHAQWLSKFDVVILSMDNDEAGKRALAKALAKYPELKVLVHPEGCKDANDALVKGKSKNYTESVYGAKSQIQDYLVDWDALIDEAQNGELLSIGVSSGIASYDYLIGGIRKGEATVLMAAPGAGKSTLVRQMVVEQIKLGNPCVVVTTEESALRWVEKVTKQLFGVQSRENVVKSARLLKPLLTFIDYSKFDLSEDGYKALLAAIKATIKSKNAFLTIIDNITHATQSISKKYYEIINTSAPIIASTALSTKSHIIVVGHVVKKVGDEPLMTDINGGNALNMYCMNVLTYKRVGSDTFLYVHKRREFDELPLINSEEGKAELKYDYSTSAFETGYIKKVKEVENISDIVDIKEETPKDDDTQEVRLETGAITVTAVPSTVQDTVTNQTLCSESTSPDYDKPQSGLYDKANKPKAPISGDKRTRKLNQKRLESEAASMVNGYFSGDKQPWSGLSNTDTTITPDGEILASLSNCWQVDFATLPDVSKGEWSLD